MPLDAVPAGDGAIEAVRATIGEYNAIEVVVGLPLHLSGHEGPSAELARQWAGGLATVVSVPVRLVDERLSTVEAQRGLRAGGRSSRESRALIDSASAVIVLQAALESEARSGMPAGEPVPTSEENE